MKTFPRIFSLVAFAALLLLNSCEKEIITASESQSFAPAADGGCPTGSTPLAVEVAGQPEIVCVCNTATYDLIDGSNSTGSPDYGSVTAGHTSSNLFVNTTLGSPWSMDHIYIYYGPTSGIPLTFFGAPDLGSFPYQQTFSPVVNRHSAMLSTSGLSGCNTLVVAADIFQLDFLGNIIQSTRRTVYLTGPPYANNWPGEYCLTACNLPVSISGCSLILDGAPGRDCTTLTAEVSGGTGPYTYAWSNGGNNASINVCPAATTTYTVTVSDGAGNNGTQSMTVNYLDIHCGNGTKVTYCRTLSNGNLHEQCLTPSQAAAYFATGNGHYGPCDLVDPCN